MARGTRKVEVAIVGDASSMVRAFRTADSAAGGLGKRAKKSSVGLAMLKAGAAAAAISIGVGLSAAIRSGVKGLADQEKASAQTAAVLKSTGNAAGVTQQHIEKFADSLERQTGLEADAVQGAQNLLLTFTKISNKGPDKIFDRATKATADLSVSFKKGLGPSAVMVGKALNDPVKGVSALNKVGVSFDEGQKKMVKSMVESGNTAGAQKLILAELEKQVKGSAEAFGETTAGKVAKAQRAFERLSESLVGAFMPIVAAVLPVVTMALDGITSFFEANMPKIKQIAVTVVDYFRTNFGPTLRSVFDSVKVIAASLIAFWRGNFPQIKAVVVPILSVIQSTVKSAFGVIAGILKVVSGILRGDFRAAWDGLKQIGSNILSGIVSAVKNIPTAILQAAKGILSVALQLGREVVKKIAEGIGSLAGLVKRSLSSLFGIAGEAGGRNPAIERFFQDGKRIPAAAAKGINAGKGGVDVALAGILGKTTGTAASNAPGKARPVGTAISSGVAKGIRDNGPEVSGAMSAVIRDAVERAKRDLETGSPSRKTARVIGGPAVEGIAKGMMEKKAKPAQALIAIMANAVRSAKSNVVSLAGNFASMFGQAMGAGQNRQISALEAAFAAEQEARQKKSLEDSIVAADAEVEAKRAAMSGAEDAAAAQKDYDDAVKSAADARLSLSDFNRQQEINNLRAIADADRTRNEEAINNLAARFANGQISAEQFNTELDALVGGEAGASLGDAFALSFRLALESIKTQMKEIATIAGSDKVAVTGASAESLRAVYNDEVAKVKQNLEATYERQSEAFKKKTTKRQYVNPRLEKWKAANKKRFGLADGGITKGPTTALIGEAGREAVIPLEGTRARRMLRATGMGGSVINLTFNGVLDAREAARVLQPELNRLIRVAY